MNEAGDNLPVAPRGLAGVSPNATHYDPYEPYGQISDQFCSIYRRITLALEYFTWSVMDQPRRVGPRRTSSSCRQCLSGWDSNELHGISLKQATARDQRMVWVQPVKGTADALVAKGTDITE